MSTVPLGEVNSSSLVPVISSVSSLSRVASVQSTPRLPSFTPSASLSKALRTIENDCSQLDVQAFWGFFGLKYK